ncbi:hypothetical protein [Pseudoalteromonas sp. XMcav2-N]|uniref:hypothetical protein n=1 Tax=Pseudoalteromonas sp. XMcav2-N TaxID=2954498 RepID=UPI002097D010|nr:hypothetical protein [Pseudoalteromonas sp. XMcav2-N]MCO7190046.1 hypothetical protein [Pseudoalteromonas sp. XMcav2-N]
MDVVNAFHQLYKRHNLEHMPYYLYGSGSCARIILNYVQEQKCIPPQAVLDLAPNTESISEALNLNSLDENTTATNAKIVIASLGFIEEITNKIVNNSHFSASNILDLRGSDTLERSWNEYSDLCSAAYSNHTKPESDFAKTKFYVSSITAEQSKQIIDAIDQRFNYDIDQRSTFGYVSNKNISSDEVKNTIKSVSYRKENSALEARVLDALKSVYSEVSQQLKSHWQTESVKVKQFNLSEELVGSEVFHLDGYNENIYKILFYLTPPSMTTGTTQFIDPAGEINTIEGEAGTFLLFNNSLVTHRGVRGSCGTRTLLEVTISKSMSPPTDNALLRFTAPLCHYRSSPWLRSAYGLIISQHRDSLTPGFITLANTETEHSLSLHGEYMLERLPKKTFDLIYIEDAELLYQAGQDILNAVLSCLSNGGDLIAKYIPQSGQRSENLITLLFAVKTLQHVSSDLHLIDETFPELQLNKDNAHVYLLKKVEQ